MRIYPVGTWVRKEDDPSGEIGKITNISIDYDVVLSIAAFADIFVPDDEEENPEGSFKKYQAQYKERFEWIASIMEGHDCFYEVDFGDREEILWGSSLTDELNDGLCA